MDSIGYIYMFVYLHIYMKTIEKRACYLEDGMGSVGKREGGVEVR